MATGRCEGCGKTGSSSKINDHTAECGDFLALSFESQFDPEQSYRQWKAEGKLAARVVRKEELATREVALRQVADARWATPPDILE